MVILYGVCIDLLLCSNSNCLKENKEKAVAEKAYAKKLNQVRIAEKI
jgi:hypothetical protein